MSFVRFLGEPGRMEINGYKGVVGESPRAVSFWYQAASGTRPPIEAQRGSGTICYWGENPATVNDNTNGSQWKIGTASSPSRIRVGARGSYLTSSVVVEDSLWHHVLVNFPVEGKNATNCDIYIDGVVDSGTRGYIDLTADNKEVVATGFPFARVTVGGNRVVTSSGVDVTIGARPTTAGGFAEYFQGDLDSFAIWDVPLSEASIAYASSSGTADLTTLPESYHMQVWLKLGEPEDSAGNGGTMRDSSADTRGQAVGEARNATTTSNTLIL